MTKADRIRKLAKQGKSDAEIARIVTKEFGFCTRGYVRTCARQRVGGQSEADRRFDKKFRETHGCSRSTFQERRARDSAHA